MRTGPFHLQPASWDTHRELLLAVRTAVFVEEQKVPDEIEVDASDPVSFHALALDQKSGEPIGTARLLPEAKIGRVAVLSDWRKTGVGRALMEFLIEQAREQQMGELTLHAQSWTIGFYEKVGFVAEGPEFDEAGIPHRNMRLIL